MGAGRDPNHNTGIGCRIIICCDREGIGRLEEGSGHSLKNPPGEACGVLTPFCREKERSPG